MQDQCYYINREWNFFHNMYLVFRLFSFVEAASQSLTMRACQCPYISIVLEYLIN
jgi:hypothetical protein